MTYREMQAALRDMVDSQGLTNTMIELAAVCDENFAAAKEDVEARAWCEDADALESCTSVLKH